jgi:hypothetical protein
MTNHPKLLNRLLICFACIWNLPSCFAVERMNLLIIQTDEHNFRTLGCYRDLMPTDQGTDLGFSS